MAIHNIILNCAVMQHIRGVFDHGVQCMAATLSCVMYINKKKLLLLLLHTGLIILCLISMLI